MKNIFSEKRSSPLLRQRKQLAPTFLALSQRAREQFSIPPRVSSINKLCMWDQLKLLKINTDI